MEKYCIKNKGNEKQKCMVKSIEELKLQSGTHI